MNNSILDILDFKKYPLKNVDLTKINTLHLHKAIDLYFKLNSIIVIEMVFFREIYHLDTELSKRDISGTNYRTDETFTKMTKSMLARPRMVNGSYLDIKSNIMDIFEDLESMGLNITSDAELNKIEMMFDKYRENISSYEKLIEQVEEKLAVCALNVHIHKPYIDKTGSHLLHIEYDNIYITRIPLQLEKVMGKDYVLVETHQECEKVRITGYYVGKAEYYKDYRHQLKSGLIRI